MVERRPDLPPLGFSVVIPTLQEEAEIEAAIQSAQAAYGTDCEILVVDGGSTDRTCEVAARYGRVIHESGGRGAQLNAGAVQAVGDVLVFLHADTCVDASSGGEIRRVMATSGVAGGCHRFRVKRTANRFDRYSLLEAGVNLRTRLLRTATGDQAIFARRDAVRKAGGCPPYPLFEDLVLVRRLRRVGRFERVRCTAWTSRRRWEDRGFLRTVILHWILRTAFHLGVSPKRLSSWYERGRSTF